MKYYCALALIFLVIGNSFCLEDDVPSLKEHFAKYFKIGTCVSGGEIVNGNAQHFINHHFNSITPENELKPDAILDQAASQQQGNNVNPIVKIGQQAYYILKFCSENGIPVRGHTLVWHSQTPDWLFREGFNNWGNYVSRDVMNIRLENFIKNTFATIKRDFPNLTLYAYDVCNEVFAGSGGGLRPKGESKWMDIYGDDTYIINAFKFARKYAPQGCKLYINDFNEYMPAKTQNILDEAVKLKNMGIIDGIGMQSHIGSDWPSVQDYQTALTRFIQTGLEVMVTELDMKATDLSLQANKYRDLFQVLVNNNARIPSVTFWGTTDERSWIKGGNPLLFSNYQPKEAYWKVMTVGTNNKEKNLK